MLDLSFTKPPSAPLDTFQLSVLPTSRRLSTTPKSRAKGSPRASESEVNRGYIIETRLRTKCQR